MSAGNADHSSLVVVSASSMVSGAERVLLRAVDRALARGVRVSAVAPAGELVDTMRAAGVSTTVVPALNLGGGNPAVGTARFAGATLRAARALRGSVPRGAIVLVNSLPALPAVRVAHLRRARVIYLTHDVVVRRDRLAALRVSKGAVDLAIAVSETSAGPLRAIGYNPTVVRNGTPWPLAPRHAVAGPPWVVGCNGALTPWKGHEVLLDAVASLPATLRDAVRVDLMGGIFAGDEAYAASLHGRARRLGIAEIVTFAGKVDEPLERMRGWHLAVSASTDPEAGPLNVLEAMSIGLPVVGTAHGGTTEVLGEAGVLVAPRDPAALAAGIEALLTDPARYAICAAAGPERVAASYRADVQIEALVDVVLGEQEGETCSA